MTSATRPPGIDRAYDQAHDDHDHGADDVVPQECDTGEAREPGHRRHAGEEADEGAVAGGRAESDGEDEHAENRSIEKRSEAVDDLDQ